MSNQKFKVLILGAGAGGISMAARLSKKLPSGSIAIVDSAKTHYYQPLWTLVGGGVVRKEETARPQSSLIPSGVEWVQQMVQRVLPKENKVVLDDGRELSYEYLIVATGLKINWESIPGLMGNLGKDGLVSVYDYEGAEKTFHNIESFKGGKAFFIMPPPPIKCAGAPQKIMYIFEDLMRKKGIRDKVEITFVTAGAAMFGIPVFAKALDEIRKEKGINVLFGHKLARVDAANKKATLTYVQDGQTLEKEIQYDFMHVVPTQSAHAYVVESGLAFTEGDQKGWLAVDKHTLQHLHYPNIFGIGDVTGVPNSKTGAAVRAQAPGLATNVLKVMSGEKPDPFYNGYSSCPLITEIGKVLLAEFGYDGKLLPTFPLDPTIPRRSYWALKRYLLPQLYWHAMLKGLA
jgi:sulfide:quinone oxidoreductase